MPSARAITRSSWSAFSNCVSPRTTSTTVVTPSSGTRSRTAPSPSSVPRKPRLSLASLNALTSLGPGGGAVGVAAGEQLLDDLGVAVGALGLEDGLAVPVDLQPAQRLEDLLDVLRASSARGRCPRSAAPARRLVAAREEPVVERGAGAADVEGAGGRGSEADAHGQGSMLEPPRHMLIGAHVSPAAAPRRPSSAASSAAPRDPDLQPEPARSGSRASTPTRRSPTSAPRWPTPTSTRC